ncbi:MAG: hypothetical protein ACREQ5_02740 [Candidatus Dormibacteria bacterium]
MVSKKKVIALWTPEWGCQAAIARRLKCSRQRVKQILLQAGITQKPETRPKYAPKMRLSPEEKWIRKNLLCAKKRAQRRGLPFSVTPADLRMPKRCPVFKTPFVIGASEFSPRAPSLDRLNPKRGYVKGNVVIISRRANTIKSDGTIAEHAAVIRYMRENAWH